MDGLSMALLYHLPFLWPLPVADFPVSANAAWENSSGPGYRREELKVAGPGWIERKLAQQYSGIEPYPTLEYRYQVDAQARVLGWETFQGGDSPYAIGECKYADGHIVTEAEMRGPGDTLYADTLTWRGEELIRQKTYYFGNSQYFVYDVQWRDGRIAAFVGSDSAGVIDSTVYVYPAPDSIHALYRGSGGTWEAGYKLVNGKLAGYSLPSDNFSVRWGEAVAVKWSGATRALRQVRVWTDALGRAQRYGTGGRTGALRPSAFLPLR